MGDQSDRERNGKRPDETPVWELRPSDPEVAQCGECFALVLRAAMKAHEHWHDRLNGRA